jgi:hypothetical protein
MVVIEYCYESDGNIIDGECCFDSNKEAMTWLRREAHDAVESNVPMHGTVHGKRECTFGCEYGRAILVWNNPQSFSGLSSMDLLK